MTDLRARVDGLTDEAKGIGLVFLAVFLFASMDAMAKGLTERYDTFEVIWARYLSQAVIGVLIALPNFGRIVRTSHLWLQCLRSAFLFGATFAFFTAFSLMSLAEATAIFEVAPLIITAMAALILGERVGPRRWLGVGLGFLGALVIIRPGTAVFQTAALLPLLAAFCFAGFSITTRFLSRDESPWTTFFYSALLGAVAASVMVPPYWITPTAPDAVLMGLLGVIGGAGQFLLILALRLVPASVIAPFTYVGLVFATFWSIVGFGQWPDLWTVAGAAIIVGAGVYVWRREQIARGAD